MQHVWSKSKVVNKSHLWCDTDMPQSRCVNCPRHVQRLDKIGGKIRVLAWTWRFNRWSHQTRGARWWHEANLEFDTWVATRLRVWRDGNSDFQPSIYGLKGASCGFFSFIETKVGGLRVARVWQLSVIRYPLDPFYVISVVKGCLKPETILEFMIQNCYAFNSKVDREFLWIATVDIPKRHMNKISSSLLSLLFILRFLGFLA